MGIQVTDLIKMFIKQGIDGTLLPVTSNSSINSNVIENLEYIRGKMRMLDGLLRRMMTRLDDLERRVSDLESPDLIPELRKISNRVNKP